MWGERRERARTLRDSVTEQGRGWGGRHGWRRNGRLGDGQRPREEGGREGNAEIQADLEEGNSLRREGTRILRKRQEGGVPLATERAKPRDGTALGGWEGKRRCREVEKREREREGN